MPLSSRQFNYLNVMNIPLWERKSFPQTDEIVTKVSPNTEVVPDEANSESTPNIFIFDEKTKNSHFVTDFIQLIKAKFELSDEQVVWHKHSIELGTFNWEISDKHDITIDGKTITTPTLSMLQNSTALKKQLWHTVAKLEQ